VKFAVESGAAAEKLGAGRERCDLTTTPWTLPHNRALAFHPDYDYVVAETSAGALLLAADLVGPALDALNLEAGACGGPWKGKTSRIFEIPTSIFGFGCAAVLADTLRSIKAPESFIRLPGTESKIFRLAKNTESKRMRRLTATAGISKGRPSTKVKTVFEANPIVVELLRDRGALLGEQKISHSYPHCWRCHNPVILSRHPSNGLSIWTARGRDGSGAVRPRALAEIAKSEMDSRGSPTNSLDDRGAARLVRLAPKISGKCTRNSLLQ